MPAATELDRPRAVSPSPPPQQSSGFNFKYLVVTIAVFFVGQAVVGYIFRQTQHGIQVPDPSSPGSFITVPANTGDIPPFALRPPPPPRSSPDRLKQEPSLRLAAPLWPADATLDFVMTVSDSPYVGARTGTEPSAGGAGFGSDKIVAREKKFRMGNWSDRRTVSVDVPVPRSVQQNGTLWAHFFIGLEGSQLDPLAEGWDPASAYVVAYPLTRYIVKKKEVKTRNLLEAKQDAEGDAQESRDNEEQDVGQLILSHYHPNVSLSFIPDVGVLNYRQLHPAVHQFVQLEATGARDGTGSNGWYYPVLFVNTFFQLRVHMYPLNATTPTVPLHVDLSNMASWKFHVLSALEVSGNENARRAALGEPSLAGGGDGSEIEMIKEVLLDTNPILLAVTAVVSVAHLVLETLAFGSDIAHYRNKRDNVGISVRTILANVVMQAIILLYLIDNARSTSWMILGSQAVGIVIELWKVTTVVDVKVRTRGPDEKGGILGALLPWTVVFEDKHQLTETEARTKEYDETAFRYLYMLGAPLLVAYAVYSLVYETHKSWYSFVITTLVGSVYAYGFLMMLPALYINYRLQSVAHMPGRAMMYKFLNTFIDDLFAFATKMPILHRLATFRDDVVFFVYLYQRWRYRIDYTRLNEFGQDGQEKVAAVAVAEAKGDGEEEIDDGTHAIEEVNATGSNARLDGGGRKRTRAIGRNN